MSTHRPTAREIIGLLGGGRKVAARTGKSANSVNRWANMNAFPARLWPTLHRLLSDAGHTHLPIEAVIEPGPVIEPDRVEPPGRPKAGTAVQHVGATSA